MDPYNVYYILLAYVPVTVALHARSYHPDERDLTVYESDQRRKSFGWLYATWVLLLFTMSSLLKPNGVPSTFFVLLCISFIVSIVPALICWGMLDYSVPRLERRFKHLFAR
jgi:hypothetical protein